MKDYNRQMFGADSEGPEAPALLQFPPLNLEHFSGQMLTKILDKSVDH